MNWIRVVLLGADQLPEGRKMRDPGLGGAPWPAAVASPEPKL